MKNKELDEVFPKSGSDPVFPCDVKTIIGLETYTFEDEHGATQFGSRNVFGTTVYKGLSQRAYVAIELRIPDSGEEWLDEMIKKANKRDADHMDKTLQTIQATMNSILTAFLKNSEI